MILMHKNIEVADVENQLYIKRVNKIYRPEHMPVGSYSTKSKYLSEIYYKKWIENRIIPHNRQNISKIIEKLGRSVDDTFIHSLGVSLTDSYWFKPNYSNLTWEDVNFHDNGFDELTENNYHHPDITTNGALEKEWINNNQIPLLVKYNDNNPVVIANEIIASQIAELMNVSCVKYSLAKYGKHLACACENIITSGERELVTALQIDHADKVKAAFTILIQDFPEELDNMLFFHVLIRNTDAHYQNIALVRNTTTLQYEGLSPLYDNGTSLGSYRIINGQVSDTIHPTHDIKDFFSSVEEVLDFLGSRILKYKLPPFTAITNIIASTYEIFAISKACKQIAIETISESYNMILEKQKQYNVEKRKENKDEYLER